MSLISVSGVIAGILAILFGISILVFPAILNYLVAFFFIIIGAVILAGALIQYLGQRKGDY